MASKKNAALAKRLMQKKGAKPDSKAPLGEGGRFAALSAKLAKRPGVTDPDALAATIGRKRLGKARFQALAAKGRKG
jgi:hypothetical protein